MHPPGAKGRKIMQTKHKLVVFAMAAAAPLALSGELRAQQPPPQFPNMTFFITSTGGPKGADLGGIAGADRHCQELATKAGAGAKTWRAYLSVQAIGGATAVNARDRIGNGPWVNTAGVQIAANVDDLHNPDKNKISEETGTSENGRRIPGRFYVVNQHDVLTGSTADGRAPPADKDMTCGNWTKSGEGNAMVGHADRMGLRDDDASKSWNASHPSRACDAASLVATGGAGLLYCFAAD
jgi:hypothetical protein